MDKQEELAAAYGREGRLEAELAKVRAVLAEEHGRVLELQRTRDDLEERLRLSETKVQELEVELAAWRRRAVVAFRSPGKASGVDPVIQELRRAERPVMVVLDEVADIPPTLFEDLATVGAAGLVVDEHGILQPLETVLAAQIADQVFGRDGEARVAELRETVLGAQPVRIVGLLEQAARSLDVDNYVESVDKSERQG